MQEPRYVVTHKTNSLPSGLKNAEEAAAQFKGAISPDRLTELADAGYLPHFRIDGGMPLFVGAEVKAFIEGNLLYRCQGNALPDAIRIVIPAGDLSDPPPSSISYVPNLQQMPSYPYQPGVYFLCSGDEVVYVGQSVSPSSRIDQHQRDPKKSFDRIYLLPVPESELDNVESAFIKTLLPKQNGGIGRANGNPSCPRMTRPVDEVLQSVGFAPPAPADQT